MVQGRFSLILAPWGIEFSHSLLVPARHRVETGATTRVAPTGETTPRGALTIAASVLPALAAVVALLLPDAAGLGLLAAGLAGVGAWDVWSAEAGGAPSWYGRLRLRATLAAAAALVVVLLSLGI